MRGILALLSLILILCVQSAFGIRCNPGDPEHCSCTKKEWGKEKGPAYLIIDSDTGCDDAAAHLMTLGTGAFKILGVTTTFGNARIADTTRNALDLLQAYGHGEIPIYRGIGVTSSPSGLDPPDWIHGKNGIGDVELPPAEREVEDKTAAEFIVEACDKYPGQVYLAFVGPLRNLADAIDLDPDLPSKWKELIVMGGAFNVDGNVSPYAEANFVGDYVAAEKVFKYGKNIKAVGLDVTNKSPFTDEDLEEMSVANEEAKLLTEIYAFYQNSYNTDYPEIGGAPPHDAIAILGLVRPDLFVWETGTISVVGEDNEYRGMSTIDTTDTSPNHQAAVSGDYLAIIEAVKSFITDPIKPTVYY